MGRVVSFEDGAVARLRDRLGVAENARADLRAFAQSHSDAVASIHEAVLTAIDAPDLDSLLGTITHDWPGILGVDQAVLAIVAGERAFRADTRGVSRLSRPIVDRLIEGLPGVEMRGVDRGHALFGDHADAVRAEALVRIAAPSPDFYGLLALGQKQPIALQAGHGSSLLMFVGSALGAMMHRWMSEGTMRG